MNSDAREDRTIDLARDVPTSPDDLRALRLLRAAAPSWLSLTAAEVEALLPPGALDARPIARSTWLRFSLD